MEQAPSSPMLGELNIRSSLDAFFLLGELLARMNAGGALVRPGFVKDITLSHRTGQWVFREADHVELQGFTPQKAATQFADFTGEPLRAVLTGYARQAYQVLEPQYPTLPGALLAQLLPAPVPTVPQPRRQALNLSRVLQSYGVALQADTREPHLTFTTPVSPMAATALTDGELLLATVTVLVAQLDLTAWLRHVAACDPTREVAQILGALARGEHQEPSWSGLVPKLLGSYQRQQQVYERMARQPLSVGILLVLVGEVYQHEDGLPEIYAQQSAFACLRSALDRLPPEEETLRGLWLAGIVDGLDELALRADQQGQVIASMHLAQASHSALQLSPGLADPAHVEAWLSRVEMQERRYSWCTLSADQPLDKRTVWTYANYAGSAAYTTRQFCQQAGEWYAQGHVTNQLWTAAWRALERLRTALRLCYAVRAPLPPDGQESTHLNQALQRLLGDYHHALKNLISMLARTAQAGRDLSQWGQAMSGHMGTVPKRIQFEQELAGCGAAYNTLLANGYGPQAIQRLGELVQAL